MSENHSYRCLLVEDVAAMRALLRVILKDTGCQIIEAENLQDARQILRAEAGAAFDVAVLDLELPDGNGLELLQEIGEKTRVIALTADDTRETSLQCLSAGCDAVLSKSDQLVELKNILMGTNVSMRMNHRTYPDLSTQYFHYLAETRLELEEARKRVDLLTVRRIVHRLRGTAIHFGHPGISSTAKSVTVALSAGRLEQVNAEICALSSNIAEALETHQIHNCRGARSKRTMLNT